MSCSTRDGIDYFVLGAINGIPSVYFVVLLRVFWYQLAITPIMA